jgi:transposase-like protein
MMAQIAAECEVHPSQLTKWKSIALQDLSSLFAEKDSLVALKASHEDQLKKLYAEIGKLTTQVAWRKKKSGIEPQERRAHPVDRTRF